MIYMYYITTSRPYSNATPHLGTSMDAIYGDVFARFQSMLNDGQVLFSMGMDDHSFKIADKAIELGIEPKQFVDQKKNEFLETYSKLNICNNNFIQSSNAKHHWVANIVWQNLSQKGYIYSKSYNGLYCKGCEDFYATSQLVNSQCPVHPYLEIQEVEETNYFFKLSHFKTELLQYLGEVNVPDTSVIVEMKNFAKDLQDISISRDKSRLNLDWGIPVWSDPTQVMYVWFEALITYLTPLVNEDLFVEFLNFHANNSKTDNLDEFSVEDLYECYVPNKFSQNEENLANQVITVLRNKLPQNLQIIGRDNAKFHLIIWPAILFGLDLPQIQNCLVHGMITDSLGRKFSKSLGNGVELDDIIEKIGAEGVRFFILNECNSIGDSPFSWERLINAYNSHLANNLGNCLMRITTLVEKYLDGYLDLDSFRNEGQIDIDTAIILKHLQNLTPEKASQELFHQLSKINLYLEETKPWSLGKDLPKSLPKIKEVLMVSAWNLRYLAEVLSIFLPETADYIIETLNSPVIKKAKILFEKAEL